MRGESGATKIHICMERPLLDVLVVLSDAVVELAIVVRDPDAKDASSQLPAWPEYTRYGPGQLPVRAAKEPAELNTPSEEIEVQVAQACVRQRHGDVGVVDDAEGKRHDSLPGPRCHDARGAACAPS